MEKNKGGELGKLGGRKRIDRKEESKNKAVEGHTRKKWGGGEGLKTKAGKDFVETRWPHKHGGGGVTLFKQYGGVAKTGSEG